MLIEAFATDILTTVRNGITKLELQGHVPNAVVSRLEDWAKVELAQTNGSGEFLLAASPVDLAAQRLWGVQVVLSTAPAEGEGLLLAQDSVKLFTDGRVDIEWCVTGDDFAKNQARLRCESRYEVGVTQPAGVVRLATATP